MLRVTAEGTKDGRPARHAWDMLDRYHSASGTTSMARTTAFPCTIVARLLASGAIGGPGVLPPERLGAQPGVLDQVLGELDERGVRIVHTRG